MKGGSLTRLALHAQVAMVSFHDHLGLKHADTQPFFLRCLEGPKQRIAHEFRRHPASIITDRQSDPAIAHGGLYFDESIASDGLAGIQHQVGNHATKLFTIRMHGWQWLERLANLDTTAAIYSL